MSSQFARMTSSLLVRKGDAGPSIVALPLRQAAAHGATMVVERGPVAFKQRIVPPTRGAEEVRLSESEKPHRIRMTVTTNDLERIGIAAVKTGQTRQQVMHAALQAYLSQLAAKLDPACGCLAGEPCQCMAEDAGEVGRLTTETRPD